MMEKRNIIEKGRTPVLDATPDTKEASANKDDGLNDDLLKKASSEVSQGGCDDSKQRKKGGC